MAPVYLIDLCQPVASIDGRRHLRSASRGQLQVLRIKMNYSAFCIYWNPSLTHHPCNSLCNAPPNSETRQEQRGHPAHMTSPQIKRVPTKQDLQVPSTCLKFGERAFSVAGPKARNDLPLHLRTITKAAVTLAARAAVRTQMVRVLTTVRTLMWPHRNTDTFKWRLKTYLFCKFYDL